MNSEITLISCNYNTPTVIETMLKSYVYYHSKGDEKLKVLISENSDADKPESQNFLDSVGVSYIRNPSGTLANSFDSLINLVNTEYALLVDSDCVFKRNNSKIFKLFETSGCDIGGYFVGPPTSASPLKPRVNPFYMYINVERLKSFDVRFNDETKLNELSKIWTTNMPEVKVDEKEVRPMYDIGCSFFEELNSKGCKFHFFNNSAFKIMGAYIKHYDGLSWKTRSGVEEILKFGLYSSYIFHKGEGEFFKEVQLAGKF